jgi:hypothetical protein
MPGLQKDDRDRIMAAGDMVVYCAGIPAIYGRQPLYFEDKTFAVRAGAPAAKAKRFIVKNDPGLVWPDFAYFKRYSIRRFRSIRRAFFLKRSLSPCVQICLGDPCNMSDQFLFSKLDWPGTSAWRVA